MPQPQHIYFTDDDGAAAGPSTATTAPRPAAIPQQQQQPAAAALPATFARCAASARVDYDTNDQCYVLKIARSRGAADGALLAAALTTRVAKAYALRPDGSLSHVSDACGHGGAITDISFPLDDAPTALFTSGADGTVAGWDLRAPSSSGPVERYDAPRRRELLSFDALGPLVAAGASGGDVIFWERRAGGAASAGTGTGAAGRAPMVEFDDMHMDDVTAARFHAPSRRLVTASTDGLVAVHDTAGGLNQDDGFVAAMNAGTSVEEVGFYGLGGARLWVRTGTESVQLWEWEKAAAPDAAGGDAAFLDLTPGARGALAEAAARAAPPAAAAAFAPGVDYLIGCHWDAAGGGGLYLAAGTNAGDVALFPIAEAPALAGSLAGQPPSAAVGPPALVLSGCHGDIVRCACFFGSGGSGGGTGGLFCATGGEDAKLAVWSLAPAAAPGASEPSSGSASSGPARHKQGGQRAAPY